MSIFTLISLTLKPLMQKVMATKEKKVTFLENVIKSINNQCVASSFFWPDNVCERIGFSKKNIHTKIPKLVQRE